VPQARSTTGGRQLAVPAKPVQAKDPPAACWRVPAATTATGFARYAFAEVGGPQLPAFRIMNVHLYLRIEYETCQAFVKTSL
jgi:hypothetical protein